MPMFNGNAVVRGGTVVDAKGTTICDVVVRGGKIASLEESSEIQHYGASYEDIDAHGKIVIPGGVDPHCHVGQKLGDYKGRDNYVSATIAALHGGTTTVVDFAIPQPDEAPLDVLRERQELAKEGRSDVAFHGCMIGESDSVAAQVRDMVNNGVRTVKLFTTYRGEVMAYPQTILTVMRTLKEFGGLPYVHAEANHIVEDSERQMADASQIGASCMALTRPPSAEYAAVSDTISLAKYVDSPVYFVHQTTGEAVDAVVTARRQGTSVFSETCPHYIRLDESHYTGTRPEWFVCCPPLRKADTVKKLIGHVQYGDIDTIGSDHCCFSTEQKAEHSANVTQMPKGLPGVETRLPAAFTSLVVEHGLSMNKFVELFSTNPARLNGLKDKGRVSVGADADLVIFDPNISRYVRHDELHMDTDYTPFEGHLLYGWPEFVLARGNAVVTPDGFREPDPVGGTLHSDPIVNT